MGQVEQLAHAQGEMAATAWVLTARCISVVQDGRLRTLVPLAVAVLGYSATAVPHQRLQQVVLVAWAAVAAAVVLLAQAAAVLVVLA